MPNVHLPKRQRTSEPERAVTDSPPNEFQTDGNETLIWGSPHRWSSKVFKEWNKYNFDSDKVVEEPNGSDTCVNGGVTPKPSVHQHPPHVNAEVIVKQPAPLLTNPRITGGVPRNLQHQYSTSSSQQRSPEASPCTCSQPISEGSIRFEQLTLLQQSINVMIKKLETFETQLGRLMGIISKIEWRVDYMMPVVVEMSAAAKVDWVGLAGYLKQLKEARCPVCNT